MGLLFKSFEHTNKIINIICVVSGYYCILGASTDTPTDGVTGDICPVGHYCPEMSSDPSPCNTGFFLNSDQNDEEADCLSCTPGEYCPGVGRELPAGNCSDGYYCPGGQNVSQPAEYR